MTLTSIHQAILTALACFDNGPKSVTEISGLCGCDIHTVRARCNELVACGHIIEKPRKTFYGETVRYCLVPTE